MKIVNELPPNIDAIRKVFTLRGNEIFAYGDTIYNPGGGKIPPWLIAHEEIHRAQQAEFGGPDEWWRKYLIDPRWRIEQELDAHRAEYTIYCIHFRLRNQRRKFLTLLARRLSGPLYGRLISFENAKKAIKS